MTDFPEQQPQHPSYPPRPPYDPAQPITTGPGTTVWPSGGPVPPSGPAAPTAAAHSPAPHRRSRRGVGLLAAVAIAAAVVGGGTATLVGRLAAGTPVAAAPAAVSGTNVSSGTNGTVAGVAQAVSPSIVEISASSNSGQSTGSGVIITADGEIVTNNHVISGASEITVRLADGSSYPASIVGTDPAKDLALIKLKGASGLKTATLGDSKGLRVGDQVVAIGSPEGLTGTVTSGIVSALDRDVTVAKDEGGQQEQQQQFDPRQAWPFEFGGQRFNGDTGSSKTTYKAIQTDASLNPGNSGGALIDMNGEIIGINSAMYSPSSPGGSGAGSIGLGFAIPVDTVKADLATLRAGGGS
ncbi:MULTISPECIES: S1C family serine protease [unclassified Streptomyces]|uniref:S1C family serine protease n=1 Tax=unclassified Streptomyces TaxID=2593676 RepID=UPI001660BB66|nr:MULTISPECIES: trypsin-like peptidase domain-containing protein [unclassified Streptomyces]MBD0712459.1 serine protease [Streptomyces sp. CBMA291]MBD0716833.1 serine protease [Streptomyces sp. CBMA370]